MAYVENAAAFLEFSLNFGAGEHLFNYIDKPDFDMNRLVFEIYSILGKPKKRLTRKKLPISSIRVKKFCSNTMFDSENIKKTAFRPPVTLSEGLKNTVEYEFVRKEEGHVFYTE